MVSDLWSEVSKTLDLRFKTFNLRFETFDLRFKSLDLLFWVDNQTYYTD